MKKKIHIPVRMGVFNDIFWRLALHFPGTPRGYANLALLLLAAAMYMPFLDTGGEDPLHGWQWLKTGHDAIKYSGFAHKTLFVSWLSCPYLIYSMVFLSDNRANAKPELFLIILGLALVSVYIHKNVPTYLDANPDPSKTLVGMYLWASACFCGFMAHTKAAY